MVVAVVGIYISLRACVTGKPGTRYQVPETTNLHPHHHHHHDHHQLTSSSRRSLLLLVVVVAAAGRVGGDGHLYVAVVLVVVVVQMLPVPGTSLKFCALTRIA